MSKPYYQVRPRFTCGSPAVVGEYIAKKVAVEERRTYDTIMEGVYGAEATAEAHHKGLDGIVEEIIGKGKTRTRRDLITGKITQENVAHIDKMRGLLSNGSTVMVHNKDGKIVMAVVNEHGPQTATVEYWDSITGNSTTEVISYMNVVKVYKR